MNVNFIFYYYVGFFCIVGRISRWPPKWGEKDFWEKSPVDSADTLQVKNFVKTDLSSTISEILKIFHIQC